MRVKLDGNAREVSEWLINLDKPFVVMTQYDHRVLPGFNFVQITTLADNGSYIDYTAYEGDTIVLENGELKIESAT